MSAVAVEQCSLRLFGSIIGRDPSVIPKFNRQHPSVFLDEIEVHSIDSS